jgi:hypothetical protein
MRSTLWVDTSDYIQNDYAANDKNLQIAASLGACNEIIRLFVRGADVNSRAGGTEAPIHYAVSSKSGRLWRYCCCLGQTLKRKTSGVIHPLVVAVRADLPVIAEKLIATALILTILTGRTPPRCITRAALGNFGITDMLLYYDARTEIPDNEGQYSPHDRCLLWLP